MTSNNGPRTPGTPARDAIKELLAASEEVARAVTMPREGIGGGFVKLRTPLATRLINAVVEARRVMEP